VGGGFEGDFEGCKTLCEGINFFVFEQEAGSHTGISKIEVRFITNKTTKQRNKMKTNLIVAAITATVAVAALSGCDKNKTPAPEATPSAAPEVAAPAAPATPEAPAAPAAPTAPAVPAAPATVTNTVSATASAADTLIAQAKSFIADKKYNDAMDALNKLSSMVLTPEQQTTVNDLKAQVQKLMSNATGTVDAAKSLLGK
jgi:hypothetical protein